METSRALAELKRQGYYVDKLWHIDDVKDNVKCSDAKAWDILDKVMKSETVSEYVVDRLSTADKELTPIQLIYSICKVFSVTRAQLMSKTRSQQKVADARQVGIWYAMNHMTMTYKDVMKLFGRSRPLMYAIKDKINAKLGTDDKMAIMARKLTNYLDRKYEF